MRTKARYDQLTDADFDFVHCAYCNAKVWRGFYNENLSFKNKVPDGMCLTHYQKFLDRMGFTPLYP